MYLPMLATPWPQAFDDPDWWFEVKWDGYRCMVTAGDGKIRLTSRRGLDLARRFPEVAAIPFPAGWVFDGEVVVFGADGRPDFSLLQSGRPSSYVAFDVLETPQGPVIDRPLEERLGLLHDAGLPSTVVTSQPLREEGHALFAAIEGQGLEGMVAKRAGSPYTPGRRSPDWRKVANRRRLRAAVGGWLPGEGARRSSFGSLLVGLWDGDDLRWIGAVGSGLSDDQLAPITEALRSLERSTSPFADSSPIPAGARWAEPGIVVEIEFKEWTRDLRLRAPVFKGVEAAAPPPQWGEEGPDAR